MFGPMSVDRLCYIQPAASDDSSELESAVSILLNRTDHPEIARWVQFPAAVLLFLVIPDDPEGGAFYVFDRKRKTWFWVDFDDQQYGGYAEAHFDDLVKRSYFLRLVEQPSLLECGGQWFVQPGSPLRCRFPHV